MFARPPRSPATPSAMARAMDRRVAFQSTLLSRPAAGSRGTGGSPSIRPATTADAVVLDALAQRDGARIPRAPQLIAELDGRVVAAIGVLDRRVIADPSWPTGNAVEALQSAAANARGPERRRRWAARLRGSADAQAEAPQGADAVEPAGS